MKKKVCLLLICLLLSACNKVQNSDLIVKSNKQEIEIIKQEGVILLDVYSDVFVPLVEEIKYIPNGEVVKFKINTNKGIKIFEYILNENGTMRYTIDPVEIKFNKCLFTNNYSYLIGKNIGDGLGAFHPGISIRGYQVVIGNINYFYVIKTDTNF